MNAPKSLAWVMRCRCRRVSCMTTTFDRNTCATVSLRYVFSMAAHLTKRVAADCWHTIRMSDMDPSAYSCPTSDAKLQDVP